jgi:hypothetical protein
MKRQLLLTTLIGLFSVPLMAQQRVCDMETTLVSPAENAVIPAYTQYNVTVQLQNNGPDNLLAGDTIYYNTSTMIMFTYDPFVLPSDINAGSSATLTLRTSANINEYSEDEVKNFCVTLASNLQHNGSFVDTSNRSNNTDCNQITLKAVPSSIEQLNTEVAATLKLYPNPAQDAVYIDLGSPSASPVQITLTDIAGRALMSDVFPARTEKITLNSARLLPGMYFVIMEQNGMRATGKLLKK